MRSLPVWPMMLFRCLDAPIPRSSPDPAGAEPFDPLFEALFEAPADATVARSGATAVNPSDRRAGHSHSMVPGGLLVMSSTTRLTSATSLVMRVEMRSSTS